MTQTAARPVEVDALPDGQWRRLRALWIRALAEDPAQFGLTLDEALGYGVDTWRAHAGRPGVFVAVCDHVDVGLARVVERDEGLMVASLWVDPTCRGMGIARSLLDAAVAFVRDRGVAELLLGVYAQNVPAIRVFERYGFVVRGPARNSGRPGRGDWFRYAMALD